MRRVRHNHGVVPEKAKRIISIAATIRNENKENILSDVTGSYTGMTTDNEHPVQDADDL